MSPRPILKRSVSTDPQQQQQQQQQQQYIHLHHKQHHQQHQPPLPVVSQGHGVHFPPSPSLTRTFTAHSAATYDRSPIVVSPNTCALPERGCPGRTYLLDEQASPSPARPRKIAYARDYHPRALAFASSNNSSAYAPVPPLVPDLSSESDESDGFYSMPSHSPSTVSQQSFGIHGLAGPGYGGSKYVDNEEDNHTLAFLPYAPSSPPPPLHFINEEGDPSSPTSSVHKHRSRKRGSDRIRHESSVDPDRIPGRGGFADAAVDPSSSLLDFDFASLSISPPPSSSSTSRKRTTSPNPPRKKGVRRMTPPSPMMMQLQQQVSAFGFGQSDDGCLGGF